MTRNEAFMKIKDKVINANDLLDGLEVLGVIKFDEDNLSPSFVILAKLQDFQKVYNRIPICAAVPEIISALNEAGYKIVRKDD